MSYKSASIAIREFLRSERNQVLCVTGSWGVGKTFAWRKIVEEEANANRIKFDSYSYVSLFGIGSLENLKKEIFKRTVSSSNPLQMVNSETAATRIDGLLHSVKGHLGSISALFGERGKAAAELISELSFSSIRERIICFDDLERVGSEIDIVDVLGLAHFLSEERGCKVAILLNESKLGARRPQYEEQFEKVIDAFVRFEPKPSESAAIAFTDEAPATDTISTVCQKLRINNIRVMKKAERTCGLLAEHQLSETELRSFAHTIALASCLKFSFPDEDALDALRSYNPIVLAMKKNKGEEVDRINECISNSGYASTEDIDRLLIDAVDNGFIDHDLFEEQVKKLRESGKLEEGEESAFTKAWRSYHNSLHHSPEEVVKSLVSAIKEAPGDIKLTELDGTLNLLDDLGANCEADEIAEFYFDARQLSHFDIEDDTFLGLHGQTNHRIVAKEKALKDAFVDERVPSEVVTRMAENSGWNSRDIDLLNSLTVEQIITMGDGLEGPNLTRDLRFLKSFVNSGQPDYQPFGDRSAEAFRQIAKRSESVRNKLELEKLLHPPKANP